MRNDYCTTIFGLTIDGHRTKKWINIQFMDILFQPNTFTASRSIFIVSAFNISTSYLCNHVIILISDTFIVGLLPPGLLYPLFFILLYSICKKKHIKHQIYRHKIKHNFPFLSRFLYSRVNLRLIPYFTWQQQGRIKTFFAWPPKMVARIRKPIIYKAMHTSPSTLVK